MFLSDPEAPQNINLSSHQNTIIIGWNPPRGRFDEIVIESTNDSFQVIKFIFKYFILK